MENIVESYLKKSNLNEYYKEMYWKKHSILWNIFII
jgi:hypothetical protein